MKRHWLSLGLAAVMLTVSAAPAGASHPDDGMRPERLLPQETNRLIPLVPEMSPIAAKRQVVSARLPLPRAIYVNDRALEGEQGPTLIDGVLMVPLRGVVEAAGGQVEWDGETQRVRVRLSGRVALLTIGEAHAELHAEGNGSNWVKMERAPQIVSDRTLISADALTTVLGLLRDPSRDDVLKLYAGAGAVVFAEVGREAVPADLAEWAASLSVESPRGFKAVANAEGTYVAISGGTAPTGGYRVQIADAVRTSEGIRLVAAVEPPAPDLMVIQVLSHPVGFFFLPGEFGKVEVEWKGQPSSPLVYHLEESDGPALMETLSEGEVPAALRGLVGDDTFVFRTERTEKGTYLVIATAMQHSSSEQLRIVETKRTAEGYHVIATVLPPANGLMTMDLRSLVGYYFLPGVMEDVTAEVISYADYREQYAVLLQEIPEGEAPAAFRDVFGMDAPVMQTVRTDEGTYLLIATAMQHSSSEKLRVVDARVLENKVEIIATVTPPANGLMTMDLRSLVGRYFLPGVDRPVSVTLMDYAQYQQTYSRWAVDVSYADVPEALQQWAEEQRERESPSFQIFPTEDGVYLGLAAGLKPTGGYQVVVESVEPFYHTTRIIATALPPDGMAITVLTNPIGFFYLYGVEGDLEVEWTEAADILEPVIW